MISVNLLSYECVHLPIRVCSFSGDGDKGQLRLASAVMLPSLLEIRMKIEYQEVVHDQNLFSLTTGTAYPSALP